MTKIFICEPLRRFCKNAEVLTGNGNTVLEVLKDVSKDLPEFKKKLFTTKNTLSAKIIIYKDMMDIRLLENEKTSVDKQTELKLVVALCGG